MRTVELFLLEGSYQAVDDGVIVELFGRTRDGTPMVARYYGFRPYFMITEPTDEVRARLHADKEIVGVEDVTTWVAGKDHPALRVTLHRPWLVPQYRDQYRRRATRRACWPATYRSSTASSMTSTSVSRSPSRPRRRARRSAAATP